MFLRSMKMFLAVRVKNLWMESRMSSILSGWGWRSKTTDARWSFLQLFGDPMPGMQVLLGRWATTHLSLEVPQGSTSVISSVEAFPCLLSSKQRLTTISSSRLVLYIFKRLSGESSTKSFPFLIKPICKGRIFFLRFMVPRCRRIKVFMKVQD